MRDLADKILSPRACVRERSWRPWLRTNTARVLLAILVATLTGAPAAQTNQTMSALADVNCSLSMPAVLKPKARAQITVTIHNNGKSAVTLLRRNTPLEPLTSDALQIEHDGTRVPYAGPVAKRAIPSAREFFHLKPGMRHSYRLAMSQGYDTHAPGEYRVSWSGDVMHGANDLDVPKDGEFTPQKISCVSAQFRRD